MDRDETLKLLRSGKDGVIEWNRHRAAGEPVPELCQADLRSTDLRQVNLSGMKLTMSNFWDADLSRADLTGSDLQGALFPNANFTEAILFKADLRGAVLLHANMLNAHVAEARFNHARFGHTIVPEWLLGAIGLEEVHHDLRSHLTVDTLLGHKNGLPEAFLKGCGLRDEEIAYFRSVVGHPIRFYSCFISYSSGDEDFASRLHNDFQAAGIRCWKWNHDARTGKSLWGEIDQAIRVHDKLVLIASESSLKSPAVNREIERAIRQEDERGTDVLFPVRVDDFIFDGWEHERKVDVTRKVIADARNWTDLQVYRSILDKLMRDLKSGT